MHTRFNLKQNTSLIKNYIYFINTYFSVYVHRCAHPWTLNALVGGYRSEDDILQDFVFSF